MLNCSRSVGLLFTCRRCSKILRWFSEITPVKELNEENVERMKKRQALALEMQDNDFFGIYNKEGIVDTGIKSSYDRQATLRKYDYLFTREASEEEEKVYQTSFGSIRYDSDNVGKREMDVKSPQKNLIEDQYIGSYVDESEAYEDRDEEYDYDNYIEDQYFNSSSKNILKTSKEYVKLDDDDDGFETTDENYFEESYFGQSSNRGVLTGLEHLSPELQNLINQKEIKKVSNSSDLFGDETRKQKVADQKTKPKFDDSDHQVRETEIEKSYRLEKEAAKSKTSKSAFDYVLKKRKELKMNKPLDEDVDNDSKQHNIKSRLAGKIDSKGFRILDNQVLNLEELPEMTVLQLLRNNILYNENDIVVLNKPYGLPVQSGEGHRHYLIKFLPQLIKYVQNNESLTQLYTVHRLDKETTGVIVLAKTQKMANKLSNMFAEGKIIKTYWALTKAVPSPTKGIIDMCMYEANVEGKSRMMVDIPYSTETKDLVKKSNRKLHRAFTSYSVLSQHHSAALVELKPTTGIKHQLRVHLATGLGCPILGDHKYSHFLRLAPQKLPSDILEKLQIRQSKVRYLAMHLHARAIAIPEIIDGRNVVVGARLPSHFSQNMKKLKLAWPTNQD